MKIAVAGTGYVGLVTGVALAHIGHDVTCVDVDEEKVKKMSQGISPIYEEGLEELMKEDKERLTYTTNYKEAYKDKDVIFIGVGTPERADGSANLDYDLIYNIYQQKKSLTETAKIIGCCEDSVRLVLKKNNISQKNILLNKKIKQSKSVAMIDKTTNQIIKIFTGTHDAAKYLGKTHQHIQEVCQGKRKSAYGYFWKYLKK